MFACCIPGGGAVPGAAIPGGGARMYQYIERNGKRRDERKAYTDPCQEELHRLHSQEACHTDLELQN
jgi:hypothetical protein